MDLNNLLTWLVCISCAANLIRGLQHYRAAQGWVIVSGLILGFLLALWYRQPQSAGLLGGLVWAIFVVLPLVSLRRSQSLAAQHRFPAAARWAYVGRLFHPLDGWWLYPQYLRALALAQSGSPEAITYFERLKNMSTGLGQAAYCNLFRIQGDWQGLRTWIEEDITLGRMNQTPRLISFYLQALGETNALDKMVETLDLFQPLLLQGSSPDWNQCRLTVFAYCGDPIMVSNLFSARPNRERQFWRATAYSAAGNPEAVQADIAELLESRDLLYGPTLQMRQPFGEMKLHARNRDRLQQWRQDVDATPRLPTGTVSLSTAPITLLLIILNVAVFMLEVQQGGSTNQLVLYQLGALVPSEVFTGGWWRLLTSTFLHFGVMHVLFNMLGLAILGPFVERQLGWLRFSIMYLAAGVGSMLTLTILATRGLIQTGFALGASGAIMGVIGAETAVLLLQWRRQRSQRVTQRLRRIGIIVLLQTFFDLTTPQISFTGHMSGLILGFLLGLLLHRHQA